MESIPSNSILGNVANFNQYEYQENNQTLSTLKFRNLLQTQRNETQKENVSKNQQETDSENLMTEELGIGKKIEASKKRQKLTNLLKGDRI